MGSHSKKNINDIRNTKVIDVYKTLVSQGYNVTIHDPHADPEEVKSLYDIILSPSLPKEAEFSAAILAVSHNVYQTMGESALKGLLKEGGLLYDLKGVWRTHDFDPSIRYLTV